MNGNAKPLTLVAALALIGAVALVWMVLTASAGHHEVATAPGPAREVAQEGNEDEDLDRLEVQR